MFDNLNESEFIQKNKERNIKWNKLNKSNKNSIIEIDSTKNFFIKSIKMANIDFEQIEFSILQFPLILAQLQLTGHLFVC